MVVMREEVQYVHFIVKAGTPKLRRLDCTDSERFFKSLFRFAYN
jgi:hypothetical protein